MQRSLKIFMGALLGAAILGGAQAADDKLVLTGSSTIAPLAAEIGKQDVGGKDSRITVVNKAEGRSTLELFLEHFRLKNSQVKAQVVIGDNQQGIKTVAGNPGAIGYVSIGTAEFEAPAHHLTAAYVSGVSG